MTAALSELDDRFQFSRRAVAGVLVAVYGVLLQLTYAYVISPDYAYFGYTYDGPSTGQQIVAVMCLFVVGVVGPPALRRTSDFILWVVTLVCVAPSVVVPKLVGILTAQQSLQLTAAVSASFVVASLFVQTTHLKLDPVRRANPELLRGALVAVSVVLNFFLAYVADFSFSFSSIDDVYGVRSVYKASSAYDGLSAYMAPALSGVVSPMLIAIGLLGRRPTFVVLGVVGELNVYSLTGLKSSLLSFLLMFVVFLYFRATKARSWTLLVFSLLAVGVGTLRDYIAGTSDWSGLFVRRVIVTPGLLTGVYVGIFSDAPKTHLRQSVFSFLGSSPYDVSIPTFVGGSYFGRDSVSANVNFFGDGFANFGWWGLMGSCGVLALALVLIDGVAWRLPIAATAIVFLVPSIALTNAGILTALLTHGILLAVLVLAVSPPSLFTPPVRTRAPQPAERVLTP